MEMRYNLFISLLTLLISFTYGHSVNNKQLLRVEPISNIKLKIAPRTDQFFEKRDISANNNYEPRVKSLQYDDSLRLSLSAFNQSLFLHLTPNLDLFHPDAVVHQNGVSTKINPADYRIYRGHVIDASFSDHWWLAGLKEDDSMMHQPGVLGWARIIVRHDIKHDLDHPLFEGAFSLNNDIYHIKLKENYHLTKRADDADLTIDDHSNVHMVIYRDSDTMLSNYYETKQMNTGSDCGFDTLTHTPKALYNPLQVVDDPLSSVFNTNLLFGKSLSKRAPSGCPTSQKVLYMGAAADCTYVKYYQTSDNARTQIINDWNSVSSVYSSTFNVGIGLINITLMDATCPTTPNKKQNWNQACSTSYSISSRLSDFSQWRGNIGDDGAGLWHLMTNCATGSEVGIAWMNQVCNTGSIFSNGQYTSGTGVSSIIRDEWKVVAHEIGHGFGAIHDCTATTCPCTGSSCDCCPYSDTQCDAQGKYFMNPTSNASSSAFSPCSIKTICGYMSTFSSCLETPGTRNTTTLQMCGNGIVESGEECDTGGQDSACCDASTCKFKKGAVCDDFNDLCCNNCQVRPANYTCRAASTECDIPEVCDGISGKCPEDKYKDDLTSCGNGLQCASGQCTSRDKQCQARGTSYNITKACGGDSSCSVTCQYGSAFSCIQFPGYFTDGTPCGVAGVCKSGTCNTDNAANNVKNWIDTHLQIFIPVVVVAGLLLLCCLWRCCCYSGAPYRTGQTVTIIPGQQPYTNQYSSTQHLYYPPPPPQQQQYYSPPPQQQGWVDASRYNGANYDPQPPLPVYTQHDPLHNNNSYELNNASQWRNNVNNSPIPNSPSPYNNGQRRYNEGVI